MCRFNGAGCDVDMNKALTQVKFTIDSDIVTGFKAQCASKGVSMTSAVRQWMKSAHPAKEAAVSTSTRSKRRKAVQGIVSQLAEIIDSEISYCDSIPEQFSQRVEAAEHACAMLEEAISCLEEAF